MRNVLESIRNRADHLEERISELEDRNLEMTEEEDGNLTLERKKKKKKRLPQKLSDSIIKCNIRIMDIPEG